MVGTVVLLPFAAYAPALCRSTRNQTGSSNSHASSSTELHEELNESLGLGISLFDFKEAISKKLSDLHPHPGFLSGPPFVSDPSAIYHPTSTQKTRQCPNHSLSKQAPRVTSSPSINSAANTATSSTSSKNSNTTTPPKWPTSATSSRHRNKKPRLRERDSRNWRRDSRMSGGRIERIDEGDLGMRW